MRVPFFFGTPCIYLSILLATDDCLIILLAGLFELEIKVYKSKNQQRCTLKTKVCNFSRQNITVTPKISGRLHFYNTYVFQR